MPDSDKLLSYDELLQETIALRQQVVDLKAHKADLELLQEVTTEHSDDVLADLHRKNQLIRKIFGRYLTDEVVTTLLEEPMALQLGGKRQLVSVLVADLRGFTALSENLSAEDVIKVLNWFLGQMTDVITQYDGTINDFTGDGIMVLFGAPTVREDDAERAVTCAVAMQRAMATVNQKMVDWDLPQLAMGIGINTGEAVVGNIGSEKHTQYSAIGKQVNLAYRIESYTVGGQILVTEQTLKQVQSTVRIDSKKQVHPKGLNQPITIVEVGGLGQDEAFLLPQKEDILYPLPKELPVKYALLEGKQIGGKTFTAHLIKLSRYSVELQLRPANVSPSTMPNPLPDPLPDPVALLMSDVKLNIFRGTCSSDRAHFSKDPKDPNDPKDRSTPHSYSPHDINNRDDEALYSNDIYAKVLNQNPEDGTACMHFTSIPPEEATYLAELYEAIRPASTD